MSFIILDNFKYENNKENISLKIEEREFRKIEFKDEQIKNKFINIIMLKEIDKELKYCFDGQEISLLKDKEIAKIRTRISYVGINVEFFNEFTVYENLEMFLTIGSIKKSDRKNLINCSLEKLDLLKIKNKLVSKLTLKEKLCLSIAKAISCNSTLTIIDGFSKISDILEDNTLERFMDVLERISTVIVIEDKVI
ncbi:MAG: ATP-binding cassette domain-containing protein [Sarcina sp.]